MSQTAAIPTPSAARRAALILTLIAVPVCVAALGMLRAVRTAPTDAPGAPEPLSLIYGRAPAFSLTERSGRTVDSAELIGRVWVADFVFTHCAGPCPAMTARMADLQSRLVDLPDVRLVSFSVDPQRDTPAVLSKYANYYGADAVRWLFLTGDLPQIQRIAVEGFKVGSIDDPVLHSTRFILVDTEGGIRGYYDSAEPDALDRLNGDIRVLLRKAGL